MVGFELCEDKHIHRYDCGKNKNHLQLLTFSGSGAEGTDTGHKHGKEQVAKDEIDYT